MIKHVYGITKTVSYMVHLIWYMEKKLVLNTVYMKKTCIGDY